MLVFRERVKVIYSVCMCIQVVLMNHFFGTNVLVEDEYLVNQGQYDDVKASKGLMW